MRESITLIKERIKSTRDNVLGWRMRIMQGEEDIFNINKRLDEFRPILKGHEDELIRLENLLKNRQGVKEDLGERT